jgi:hypothetical protein
MRKNHGVLYRTVAKDLFTGVKKGLPETILATPCIGDTGELTFDNK